MVCGPEDISIMTILALSQPREKLCGRRRKNVPAFKKNYTWHKRLKMYVLHFNNGRKETAQAQ
jgi:hypothetical protein